MRACAPICGAFLAPAAVSWSRLIANMILVGSWPMLSHRRRRNPRSIQGRDPICRRVRADASRARTCCRRHRRAGHVGQVRRPTRLTRGWSDIENNKSAPYASALAPRYTLLSQWGNSVSGSSAGSAVIHVGMPGCRILSGHAKVLFSSATGRSRTGSGPQKHVADLAVAHAAFTATVAKYPDKRIFLREGCRVIPRYGEPSEAKCGTDGGDSTGISLRSIRATALRHSTHSG